jgi:hypothetical protein
MSHMLFRLSLLMQKSDYAIISQGNDLAASAGSAPLAICYSTDSWHQAFGQIMQAYIAGTTDKDATCAGNTGSVEVDRRQ